MGGHIVLLAGGSPSAALAVLTVRASNGLSLATRGRGELRCCFRESLR